MTTWRLFSAGEEKNRASELDIYFCGLWGEIVCLKEETRDSMSKLFHVTLQKWQAQTGDLLEMLT